MTVEGKLPVNHKKRKTAEAVQNEIKEVRKVKQ